MIVKFNFNYGYKPSPEEVERINKILLGEKISVKEDGSIDGWKSYKAELSEIYEITNKISFEEIDTDIIVRLYNLIERNVVYKKEHQFNEKIAIHISDLGLMSIKEVEVEVDCCTEKLNDRLQEGWRIIAVCPQPSQRRPDYILGKS